MIENMKYNAKTYQFRKDALLKILKIIDKQEKSNPKGILFFGDSLVENIPKDYPIINNGIGGMTSKALESLLDELVIKFKPSKVYQHIGTNDLGQTVMESPRDIALNVERIFRILSKNLQNTEFYLISCLPNINAIDSVDVTGRGIRSLKMIEVLNKEFQYHLEGSNIHYLDLYQYLINEDGSVKEEYYSDGLHINELGYEYLFNMMKRGCND